MPNGTNGDIVSPRINATDPASLQPQPPHFGIISDDDGSPSLEVLWDTFNPPTTVVAAMLADTGLDVIENPTQQAVITFLGKTVIPILPTGGTKLDASGGTSRE